MVSSPLEKEAASALSSTLDVYLSERSIGFETSSKLEVSASPSSESASSLSANFDARVAMELVCSFMDGGGPREEVEGCGTSFAFSGSCFAGDRVRGDTGAFEVGL